MNADETAVVNSAAAAVDFEGDVDLTASYGTLFWTLSWKAEVDFETTLRGPNFVCAVRTAVDRARPADSLAEVQAKGQSLESLCIQSGHFVAL